MKPIISGAFVAALILLYPYSLCAQGSLTPPGPPGPTMLTLLQVEPRTPVDSVHTPGNSAAEFVITNAGSYYLTTNIAVNTGIGINGIEIATNNVTLDLNGFSLTGFSTSGYGIYLFGGCSNIVVHDGSISGWNNSGVHCQANNVTLERLTVSGCNSVGVGLYGSGGVVMRDSTVSGNSASGIYCLSSNVIFEGLTISGNGDDGMYISGVTGDTLRDCTVSKNVENGVECDSSTNVTFERLNVFGNDSDGLVLFDDGGSVISDCAINGNTSAGVFLTSSGCSVLGNNCSGNSIGIYIVGSNNRIENNHVTASGTYGIQIYTLSSYTNNIVIRNSVEGNGASDYSFDTSQIVGPLINNTVSGIITNSNPWANFAF
jgi:parallel beta-helix repeat protein